MTENKMHAYWYRDRIYSLLALFCLQVFIVPAVVQSIMLQVIVPSFAFPLILLSARAGTFWRDIERAKYARFAHKPTIKWGEVEKRLASESLWSETANALALLYLATFVASVLSFIVIALLGDINPALNTLGVISMGLGALSIMLFIIASFRSSRRLEPTEPESDPYAARLDAGQAPKSPNKVSDVP